MKILHLLITIVLLVNSKAVGQVFYNSVPIDTLRYADIKGSPYLYPTWQKASIVSRDGTVFDSVWLNFNGYKQTFEAKQFRQTVTLDANLYDEITIYADGVAKEWFIKGLHYDIATRLANVIYNGDKIKLIRNFNTKLAETTDEIPGSTIVHQKFYSMTTYTIIYQSRLRPVRLTKNKLGRVLNDAELVNALINQYNLDPGKEEDAIKLLKYFEESKYE